MISQFDLGNSSVKWRITESGRVLDRGALRYSDELPAALLQHIAGSTQLQLASVAADTITENFEQRLRACGGGELVSAHSQSRQCGLVNAYAEPQRLGVDRWLAMLGAWTARHEPAVIVDAGSAITIDIVLDGGQHAGGYIIPGRNLMLGGLASGTSRVAFEVAEDLEVAPGTDTQSCVGRGVNLLLKGLADQVREVARQHSVEAIWVTGGDASHLRRAGLAGEYVPDLVLDGLAEYCRHQPDGASARSL